MKKSNSSQLLLQADLFKEDKNPKEVFRYLRNFLAGQFVGASRDEVLLDELLKCLFCKLHLEVTGESESSSTKDDVEVARFYRSVFSKVRKSYSDFYSEKDEFLLDPRSLVHVLRCLDFSLLDSSSDVVGDAFEVFAGSESRGRSGQFFTPRNACDLLVEAVNPKVTDKIIDPACGAGGFLASTLRYFRKNGSTTKQIVKATSSFYGIEKDDYLARLARFHVALLSAAEPNIFCGDSLAFKSPEGDSELTLPDSGYDVVLTNPPFGVKIVAANSEVLQGFDLARRWTQNDKVGAWKTSSEVKDQVPPQVLFIERCIKLLRPGGKLGMVLPESVLSNKSYRFAVQYLLHHCEMEAVIGMPEALFKTSGKGGTHTKTCLVVARRKPAATASGKKIFMAEARWCGKDSRAREIPKDDLPTIASKLADHNAGKKFDSNRLGFLISRDGVTDNVLCPRFYDPELDIALEAIKKTHDLVLFGDLLKAGEISLTTGDEVGKLAYGTGDVPFIRTSDLSNWEIKVDPKHCVDQKLFETLRRKQDVKANDILMVKDGTYLIGSVALVTKYDERIVYQSHLYKIRVESKTSRIDPFYLLAALNSEIVQRQIKAKQFTQDIIDSLGDRIRELAIPIPKKKGRVQEISKMVQKVISERVEARELAREAMLAVMR